MELQIFTLLFEVVLSAALSFAGWKLKQYRDAEQKFKFEEQRYKKLELLNTRMILIRECTHYLEKGFAPIYARSAVIAIYNEYHNLGGNGGIEELYREFLNLPFEKRVEIKK